MRGWSAGHGKKTICYSVKPAVSGSHMLIRRKLFNPLLGSRKAVYQRSHGELLSGEKKCNKGPEKNCQTFYWNWLELISGLSRQLPRFVGFIIKIVWENWEEGRGVKLIVNNLSRSWQKLCEAVGSLYWLVSADTDITLLSYILTSDH